MVCIGFLCHLHGDARGHEVRSRLLLWGSWFFPSSVSCTVSFSPPLFPGLGSFARFVAHMAFAIYPFGFGILVYLTPAPEVQYGFLVGYVFGFYALMFALFGWYGVG